MANSPQPLGLTDAFIIGFEHGVKAYESVALLLVETLADWAYTATPCGCEQCATDECVRAATLRDRAEWALEEFRIVQERVNRIMQDNDAVCGMGVHE